MTNDRPAFDIFKDQAGEWRWRLVAGNHEIVASSEGYTRHEDVIRGAKDMARNVFVAAAKLAESTDEQVEAVKAFLARIPDGESGGG